VDDRGFGLRRRRGIGREKSLGEDHCRKAAEKAQRGKLMRFCASLCVFRTQEIYDLRLMICRTEALFD
jgi:hypothetical protein